MPSYQFPPSNFNQCGCNDNQKTILQKILDLLLALGQVITNNLRLIASVVLGQFEAVGTFNVTTNATGSSYQALPSNAATAIRLNNNTGTDIEVRLVGSGSTTPEILPDGNSVTYPVAANSNEWEVRRVDQSNTTVTLTGTFIYIQPISHA